MNSMHTVKIHAYGDAQGLRKACGICCRSCVQHGGVARASAEGPHHLVEMHALTTTRVRDGSKLIDFIEYGFLRLLTKLNQGSDRLLINFTKLGIPEILHGKK